MMASSFLTVNKVHGLSVPKDVTARKVAEKAVIKAKPGGQTQWMTIIAPH